VELRNAWWDADEANQLSVDGQKLGAIGDDTDLVELAVVDLDATIGADNFQISDNGDILVAVGDQNYSVFLATVKHPDGRADDKLAFVGVKTDTEFEEES